MFLRLVIASGLIAAALWLFARNGGLRDATGAARKLFMGLGVVAVVAAAVTAAVLGTRRVREARVAEHENMLLQSGELTELKGLRIGLGSAEVAYLRPKPAHASASSWSYAYDGVTLGFTDDKLDAVSCSHAGLAIAGVAVGQHESDVVAALGPPKHTVFANGAKKLFYGPDHQAGTKRTCVTIVLERDRVQSLRLADTFRCAVDLGAPATP